MSEVRKKLDEPIPRSAISTREAGNGVKLDYLTSFYVIQKLNEVLGQGNWAYSSEVQNVYSGKVESKYGESFSTSYIAQVRLVVTIDGNSTEFTDFGYGDGSDKKSPGKAHELAVKEAVTDGLKRCAKNLGMAFGLALYDKTQEFVNDGPQITPTASQSTSVGADSRQANGREESSKNVKTSKVGTETSKAPSTTSTKRPTRELIKSAYSVLKELKKTTPEEFTKTYLDGAKVDQLSEKESEQVLLKLKNNYPELPL